MAKGMINTSEWGRNDDYQNSADLFSKMSGTNTGEGGYNKSLGMAGKGATVAADKAKAEAQSAARNAGMSKSQAAMMGANQTANAYANNFQNQQNMASNQLNNQLQAQGNLMSSRQTEANNEWQRGRTNFAENLDMVANVLGGINGYAASGKMDALGNTIKNAWGGLNKEFNPSAEEFSKLSADEMAEKKKEFEKNKFGDFLKTGLEIAKFAGTIAPLMSDENTKDYEDVSNSLPKSMKGNKDLIDAYSKISAIDFTYKPEVVAEKEGVNGVDTDEHVGVKAQDLEDNPATPNVVKEQPDGKLAVDTQELTMSNTAAIAELSRKIQLICEKLGV